MSDFDVGRSTAIIQRAIEHGIYQAGAMPEGDGDKQAVAEQLVQIARQAETVARAVGIGQVPMWPAAEAVLVEAGLINGNGSEPHEDVPLPAPDLTIQHTTTDKPKKIKGPDYAYITRLEHELGIENGEMPQDSPVSSPVSPPVSEQTPSPLVVPTAVFDLSQVAPPIVSVPEQVPPSVDDAPQDSPASPPLPAPPLTPALATPPPQAVSRTIAVGEVWADAQGGSWEVVSYNGGQNLEARSSAGEMTILPVGFLKTRVSAPAPAPVQETPQPQPEPEPQQVAPVEQPPDPVAPPPSAEAVELAPPMPVPVPAAASSAPLLSLNPTEYADEPVPDVPDDEGDEKYAALLEGVDDRFRPAGMSLPHDVDDPPSVMPEDLVDVSDLDARRLHSMFNALAARAKYLHDLESARARACEMVRKMNLGRAMHEARGQMLSSATLTEVKQEAEQYQDVQTWSDRESKHREAAMAYSTFFNIYTQNVAVLSRDWSMRDKQTTG